MAISLQVNRLRAARSKEEFGLHRAAIEWDLDASLSINDPDDIESRKHWSDRLEPFEHQIQNLITFCRRAPVALIADDVGLGKTISAGLVLSELFTRRKIRRALVICPKILLQQWKEELEDKFGIRAIHAVGAQLEYAVGNAREGVVITTYDSARNRMEVIKTAGFDVLILDEAHKLRNLHGPAGAQPPRFAVAVRAALADRIFTYVLMLTATPVKNRLWDLYSLIDCLTAAKGHKNPLGTRTEFTNRYLVNGATALQINPGRRDEFRKILADYMVRTRRADARLQFPDRKVETRREAATPTEARLMGLVGKAISGLPGLLQVSVAQALMSSPEALLSQLENMRAGVSPELLAAAREAAQNPAPTAKMQLLLRFLETLKEKGGESWRAVVFTTRKETQTAIGSRLTAAGHKIGFIRGAQAPANDRAIKAFWKDPPDVNVLISTDAGAEGINLQVANVIVNYDLPWDPMIVEQRVGRVQRLKSRFNHVVVLNLTVAGSVEERVVARLLEKLQLIAHTVGDVEAILESVSETVDDEDALEGTIQRLVIQSLAGADVERDLRLAAESIDRAKKIYEDERQVVESQLGNLDNLHRTGPRMPKLAKTPPSMPVQEFVLAAMQASGGQVAVDRGPFLRAIVPGRAPFLFTFDESAEGGPGGIVSAMPIRVFAEGRPDFTRLVGEWTKRAEHLVLVAPSSDAALQGLVSRWCAQIAGAQLVEVARVGSKRSFQGDLLCRIAVGVAHDRYEKLVAIPSDDTDHPRIDPARLPAETVAETAEVEPTLLLPNISGMVEAAATWDADIGAFAQFYKERLKEEVKAAGGKPDLERKARDSFEPALAAEVVGASGVSYEALTVRVSVQIGEGSYSAELEVLPLLECVLQEPAPGSCEVSGQRVPDDWLERCSVTGKTALRHLFATSAESGNIVLRELLVACPHSGDLVLPTELETSAVSGLQARRSLLGSSAISGARALPAELVTCEFTGAVAVPSELGVSQVSGKRFRLDQGARSAVSGTTGHLSEFLICSATGGALLPSEAGASALSSRVVRADLLKPSEKAPHRRGLADELVNCSRTGKWLLRDEVVESAVSGIVADRDLAAPSAASGRWALREELVTCEETRASLLPTEVGRCCLSGRVVDQRILSRSAVSGAFALERLMERCSSTGQLGLPSELATCEITGQRVLHTQLETCSVTGKRALRTRLVRSVVSGVFMVPERAVRSVASGSWCAPNEVVRCTWTHGVLLPRESRICSLTGLRFDARLVNESGELSDLRDLMDGQVDGRPRNDIVAWLRQDSNHKSFRSAQEAWVLTLPTGDTLAACVEIRSLLGMRVRHVALVAKDGANRHVLGRCLEGRRTASRWVPEREARSALGAPLGLAKPPHYPRRLFVSPGVG